LDQDLVAIIAAEVNVKTLSFTQDGEITLDLEITQTLKEEGIVRDAKRFLQDQRKLAGKLPSERIAKAVLAMSSHDTEVLARYITDLQVTSNIEKLEVRSHEGVPTVSFE
jgi:hypothetical protein